MSSKDIASDQEPPATEPTFGLPLPYELVLTCLALVTRFHYPVLSLVSRTFRSITSSPELYQTRSLLNRTEKCLYVCLQFPTEPNLRWFALWRKPTLNNKKTTESSNGNILVPVQILNSPPMEWSDLVAVGHKLYAINKEDDDVTCSSNVFFLDCRCRTHTWVETPSLRLAHTVPELDGVMYLAGSYENPDSLNCVEVLNTETQTWKAVPEEKRISAAGDFQGKAYKKVDSAESGRSVFLVNMKDCTKELVEFGTSCLIEKIFYCYGSNGEFLWSNNGTQVDGWKKVQGLEELSKSARYSNVKLVECGGKMMVFWDEYVPASGGYKEQMIWCAEVSLEMRSSEEVWGAVQWSDAVLTVPKSYKFVYAIAATV